MQKGPERADAHARSYPSVSRAVNTTRSDYDIRDGRFFRKLRDDLLLLNLSEAVRTSRVFRMRFDGTGFVQLPRFLAIAIDRERADKDKSFQARILRTCLQKVPRSDDGVHKGIRKRLLSRACCQVIDDCHTLTRRFAVRAGKQISSKHLHARPRRSIIYAGFEPRQVTRGSDQTDHIAKPSI